MPVTLSASGGERFTKYAPAATYVQRGFAGQAHRNALQRMRRAAD